MAFKATKAAIEQKKTAFPCGCRLITHRWKIPAGFDLEIEPTPPGHIAYCCSPDHRETMLERLVRRYGPDMLCRLYDPDFPR